MSRLRKVTKVRIRKNNFSQLRKLFSVKNSKLVILTRRKYAFFLCRSSSIPGLDLPSHLNQKGDLDQDKKNRGENIHLIVGLGKPITHQIDPGHKNINLKKHTNTKNQIGGIVEIMITGNNLIEEKNTKLIEKIAIEDITIIEIEIEEVKKETIMIIGKGSNTQRIGICQIGEEIAIIKNNH